MKRMNLELLDGQGIARIMRLVREKLKQTTETNKNTPLYLTERTALLLRYCLEDKFFLLCIINLWNLSDRLSDRLSSLSFR